MDELCKIISQVASDHPRFERCRDLSAAAGSTVDLAPLGTALALQSAVCGTVAGRRGAEEGREQDALHLPLLRRQRLVAQPADLEELAGLLLDARVAPLGASSSTITALSTTVRVR